MVTQTRLKMLAAGLAAGSVLGVAGVAAGQTSLDGSRAYASEMLADAAGRTNSLAQPGSGFTVQVHGWTRFQFNINQRDDDGLDSNNNDLTTGFRNAQTRLSLAGNVGNENWGYKISFDFADSTDGMVTLKDVYGTYKAGNGWKWTFGQFKLPLYREELMGDEYQLFTNRSVNNGVFSQSRSQGIQAGYETDNVQFFAAFSDGIKTNNTDYTSTAEADWAVTGRVNYKWAGDWKQAKDFTSFQNSDYFGMAGIAAHFQDGGDTVGTANTQRWDLTADAQAEGNGWNVYLAAMARDIDPSSGMDFLDYGFIIQGGIFVAPQFELIGGYDIIIPDSDRTSSDSDFSTIRVGFNYYVIPDSHALKATVDLSYFLDKQSDGLAPVSTATGLLGSSKDSQWNLRGQFQMLF